MTSVRKLDGNSAIDDLDRRWVSVGDDVLKQLSLGRLNASGREIRKDRHRLQAALIPSVFWRTAKFTYWFLDRDGADVLHVENDDGIQYANLEVNRAQAWDIWPNQDTLPIRISLEDFLHIEGVKIGWAPRPGNQTNLADLIARTKQAAIDDELHFWGREAPITLEKGLLAHRPLVRVKKEYWEHHDIEYTSAIFSKNIDNYSQRALIHSRAIDGQESYRDLHLDRQEALDWLRSKGRP